MGIASIIGAILAILKPFADWFSAAAQLGRIKVSQARQEAKEAVESERLKAAYERIESEASPENIVKALNEAIKRSRPNA